MEATASRPLPAAADSAEKPSYLKQLKLD